MTLKSMDKLIRALCLTALISCDAVTAPDPVEEIRTDPEASPTSPCPGYADPGRCPPFPTGGPNVITSTVLERTRDGTKPLAGARVWAWVQYSNGNGYSAGSVSSDADGNYRFPLLPDAFIVLQTGGDYDQPCAATLQLSAPGASANIEAVAAAAPIYDPDPPPRSITGVVYENTPNGRHPMAGVRVFVETLSEIVTATTTTDAEGRYSVCRLPSTGTFVTPFLPGYQVKATEVVLGDGVIHLDLEMRR